MNQQQLLEKTGRQKNYVDKNSVAKLVGTQLLRALEDTEAELDDEISKLEKTDADELERIRSLRLRQLKQQAQATQNLRSIGHGTYNEVVESEFFDIAKKSYYLVAHFFRSTTPRCEIVDKHLTCLASKHINTRFVKLNAEKSYFLTNRLQIRMLPSIVLVKGGKTSHTIIGFDELGGDDFKTQDFERLLEYWGVIGCPIPPQSKENDNNDN